MTQSQLHSARTMTDQEGLVNPEGQVASRRERRQRNRVLCEGLTCSIGSIIGLSGTGMRIRARGWCRLRKDDLLVLDIRYADVELKVKVRIAWVKKVGMFQYEAGMAFEDLTLEQTSRLGMIAQMAMPKLVMRRGTLPDLPTD